MHSRNPTCMLSPLLNRGATGVAAASTMPANGMQHAASSAPTLTLEAELSTPPAAPTTCAGNVLPARARDCAAPLVDGAAPVIDVRAEAVRVILAEAAALQVRTRLPI
jgi:hypothetical protein